MREVLAGLPEQSVQTIVTSPPYWGLRDYGIPPSVWGEEDWVTTHEHEWGEEQIMVETTENTRWQHTEGGGGQNRYKNEGREADEDRTYEEVTTGFCDCGAWRGCLGLEPTPDLFIEHLVEVCRALWRVLRDDGTFWLNLGDSYCSTGTNRSDYTGQMDADNPATKRWQRDWGGLKPKDLVMMPHRVALALQEDGWWVRSTIVWSKPNPMPESCRDRPTSSHEYIFLLTKKARYFYDNDAVREEWTDNRTSDVKRAIEGHKEYGGKWANDSGTISKKMKISKVVGDPRMGRNLRSVWTITTQSYKEAHFATFPEKIPDLCIKAGTSERGCCPQCGAPWERVVEKPNIELIEPAGPKDKMREEQRLKTSARMGGGAGWRKREEEALAEWKRSCGADSKGEYHGKAVKDYEGTGAENPSEVKARILHGMVPKRTVGYQQTCECPPELEPIPCTVLDPFAGSGTTLKVARDLGRSAIGIDINDDYKKLAVERARLDTKDIMSYAEEKG